MGERKRSLGDPSTSSSTKKVATVSSVFGPEALAAAEAAESEDTATAIAAVVSNSTRRQAPTSRRQEAKIALEQGGTEAEHGDFDTAINSLDRGLRLLGAGPRPGVAAVSASEVAAAMPAGVKLATDPDAFNDDDDVGATRHLCAQLYEAKAQIFLMLPDTTEVSSLCKRPLRLAEIAAEASVTADPQWAPAW